MPNDSAAPFLGQTVLGALEGIVLVITANLFDTLIKDNKVLNKIKKTLLIEHCIDLLIQRILNILALFFNQYVGFAALMCKLGKAIVLPLVIVLFGCEKCTVTQAFAVITCHTELHRGKELFNEMRLLIGKILTNTLGDRYTTALELNNRKRNAVNVDNKVGAFGILANNGYFLSNGKVILRNIGEVEEEHGFRRFSRFFGYLCTVFEQTVDFFVCIIKTVLEISCGAYKLIDRPARQLVRIASLVRQIGIETLLHDIAVFAIVQVAEICIMELVYKEFYNTVLC